MKKENPQAPSPWEIARAVETLTAAGFVFQSPESVRARYRLYTLKEAAQLTGMDLTWLRRHQNEFPNSLKPPGTPLRLRESDIVAAYKRWQTDNVTRGRNGVGRKLPRVGGPAAS
jgi:hypothetical protein